MENEINLVLDCPEDYFTCVFTMELASDLGEPKLAKEALQSTEAGHWKETIKKGDWEFSQKKSLEESITKQDRIKRKESNKHGMDLQEDKWSNRS